MCGRGKDAKGIRPTHVGTRLFHGRTGVISFPQLGDADSAGDSPRWFREEEEEDSREEVERPRGRIQTKGGVRYVGTL